MNRQPLFRWKGLANEVVIVLPNLGIPMSIEGKSCRFLALSAALGHSRETRSAGLKIS